MSVDTASSKLFAALLIPLAALVPWMVLQFDVALNTNHAWLGIAAHRLLDGGSMSGDFYDPNPPLSVLIYLPHALLSKLTGIPFIYMPALIGMFILSISTLASTLLLRKISNITAGQHVVILTAYLLAGTYLAGNWYFADRDALVIWGLFPFLLGQYALTRRDAVSRPLLWFVFAIGAVPILIKPHYGIFAVLMLLHRAIAQRRLLTILRDPDTLCLAGAVIGYGLVCLLFFPDYLHLIAPEMRLYVGLGNPAVPVWTIMLLGLVAVLAATPSIMQVEKDSADAAKVFLLGAMLCLALYLIQMKGFFYHLIPFMVFLYIGLSLLVLGVLQTLVKTPAFTVPVTVGMMTLLTFLYAPPDYKLIRHADYAKTELGKLASQCAPDCSILIISENMETAIQVSTYTDAAWASRYPVLWWLPALHPDYGGRNNGNAAAALERHLGNVAADIEKYRPATIAVILNTPLFATGDKNNFDYMAFLNTHPAVAAALAPYRNTRIIEDNAVAYFYRHPPEAGEKPFVYAIYERQEAPSADVTKEKAADITAP